MAYPSWQIPSATIPLPESEVHVWRASLESSLEVYHFYLNLLSTDEQQRAARFHFEHHRHRFTVGRAILRLLLGQYLAQSPTAIQFEYGPQGKPNLPAPIPLHFNVSHSETVALYAFSRTRFIGVDVEYHKPNIDYHGIAKHFFAEAEQMALLALPPAQQPTAFYACWTRKEAYLKATGDGLTTIPLSQFEVSLRPNEAAALLATHHAPQEAARWTMQALAVGPGYTAALVIEGQDWELKTWQYQPR